MIERFGDDEQGGFFETSSDHEQLVARRKDLEDHPIPAGNSSAAYGLLRLSALTGEHAYAERAESVLRLLHELAPKHPQAFGHLLQALDFRLARVREVALVGPELGPLERVVRDEFRPHLVLAGGEPDGVPLLAGREPVEGRPTAYVCEAVRVPDARDRAARAGGAARLIAALLAVMAGAVPAQEAVPVPADAHRVAVKISSWGPRPAASEREARAHRLIARVFRRAELRVGIQEFRVPGRGRSRNVIGILDTPRSCLRIVMAHADSTPNAPGANDNASGLGVVASLAGRLERIRPWCDVWLVATGAEERVYTGQPDHLGALALARRARSHGARDAAPLRAIARRGRARPPLLAALARERRRGRRSRVELLAAASRVGVPVSWVRDEGSGNSDHREFELIGLPGAKLGVGAGGEPCRHSPCDRPSRLDPKSLVLARRLTAEALRSRER